MSDSLRSSFLSVIWYIGVALIFVGFVLLVPLAMLFVYPGEMDLCPSYALPSVTVTLAGYLVYFHSNRDGAPSLNRKESGSVIVLVWVLAILVNALPLMTSGLLSPVHALFEATSGLTTTGFTVIDADCCPKVVLLHRSLMHYLGGVGLILVMTSVISDSCGLGLYNAEGHADRLLAGSARSARAILILYTGVIFVGSLAYVIEGMPAFDAMNIAVSAVSTGGFAVRSDSLASYDNLAVELTTVVLMVAGATTFLLTFRLAQGRFRSFFTHAETPALFGIIVVSSLLAAISLLAEDECPAFPQALRVGLFHVVAVMTSTGLQTVDTSVLLCPPIQFIFIVLMFVGGEAGSTAGGIKVFRIVMYVKGALWHVRNKLDHSRRVHSNEIYRFGRRTECDASELLAIDSFVGIYFTLFAICAFLFTLFGASVGDAIFDAASCLGNTGFGTGFVGADSPSAVLLIACVTMLFGRLEILPILLGFIWMLRLVKRSVGKNGFVRKAH